MSVGAVAVKCAALNLNQSYLRNLDGLQDHERHAQARDRVQKG